MSNFLAIVDPPKSPPCHDVPTGRQRSISARQRNPTLNTVMISCFGDVGVAVDRRYQITKLTQGGAADKSGRLQVGDTLLRVNGTCTAALEYERIVSLLRSVNGNLELKVMASESLVFDAAAKGFNEGAVREEASGRQEGLRKTRTVAFDMPDDGGGDSRRRTESRLMRSQTIAADGRPSGTLARRNFVQLRNWQADRRYTDTLHSRQFTVHDSFCDQHQCQGSIMYPVGAELKAVAGEIRSKDDVIQQAEAFLNEYFESLKKRSDSKSKKCKLEEQQARRMKEVIAQVELTGTYDLDEKELVFGAKLAWRNSPRCIGRIQWNRLQVFDCRHINSGKEMEDAIIHHIKFATNEGNLRSAITVFPQRTGKRDDFRIWSPQFFRYAGYKMDDGSIVGDPGTVEFTEKCIEVGWRPPKEKGQFDLLPIVVHSPNELPKFFDVSSVCLEVPIRHPEFSWFDDLALKWYALPAVSSLMLDVGGIQFTAAPFNGWYMAPEIAARNFGDSYRYNMLEPVAEKMGLDTSNYSSLWKDRALVELNLAVLHSFKEAQVTISDHHSAAESFMQHMEKEMSLRGGCPSDWVWIVPPLSGSATPVFHQEMLNYKLKPSFEYQEPAWMAKRMADKDNPTAATRRGSKLTLASAARVVMMSMSMFSPHLMKRVKATVLYATETGKSERYAKDVGNLFSHAFAVNVQCMEDFVFSDIEYEQLLLVVTSTFGNGDPPDNGESFGRQLYEMRHPPDENRSKRKVSSVIHLGLSASEGAVKDDSQPLANVRFSAFGLGSRAYPNFCAFARSVDKLLGELGGERIYEIGQGDELCGQEESFRKWVISCYEAACKTFCVDANLKDFSDALASSSREWQPDKFRLVMQKKDTAKEMDVCKCLSDLHKKSVFPCQLISRTNLQSEDSPRSTILVKLGTQGEEQLAHEPGDHLAIFPQNQPSLVNQLLKKLDGAPLPDEPLIVEYEVAVKDRHEWKQSDRLPLCTLRQAFSQFLDITTPPSPQFLSILAPQATDKDENARILELSKGTTTYEDWKFDKCPNICEVLEEFPSLKIPPSLLLSQLPLIQSRYYSISSSKDYIDGEIHCTVAVVSFRTHSGNGPLHHGVCSSWLNRLTKSAVVPCFVRRAQSFYLPEDKNAPIILVGPGTGIAPFRSFWQQRVFMNELSPLKRNKVEVQESEQNGEVQAQGDMLLFFGCRNPDLDHIYKEEVAQLVQEGILKNSFCAYSRDPNQPKQYVQDQLKQHADIVVQKLLRESGHLYVCGDVSMAADVTRTIEAIFQTETGMSSSEARSSVEEMRANGFYHEDIFGVTLRTAEVTDRVRNATRRAWSIIVESHGDGSQILVPAQSKTQDKKQSMKKKLKIEVASSETKSRLRLPNRRLPSARSDNSIAERELQAVKEKRSPTPK